MLFEADGLIGLLFLALWAYAIFDVIATEEMLVRNLPRMAWLVIVILLPDIGAIAWLALGRPFNAGWRPGDTRVRTRRRVVGPEDHANWAPPLPSRPTPSLPTAQHTPPLEVSSIAAESGGADPAESLAVRERRLMEWEAELKRREAELDDGEAPSAS